MSSRVHPILAIAVAVMAAGTVHVVVAAEEYNGRLSQPRVRVADPSTRQIIVKWRLTGAARDKAQDRAALVAKLASATGMRLEAAAAIAPALDVLKLETPLAGAELAAALQLLRADEAVQYAEPDERRHAHAVPNDPLFVNQWYHRATQISATRAEQAWDTSIGVNAQVVAVLDTGVRFEHPDLTAKLLPGFDFISSAAMANDGGGRDADAADAGDWIDSGDLQNPPFNSGDCALSDSSWHGTRVSGIIGAATNNAQGMAGVSWNSPVLPVRVLGKCGGNDSDILPAMRWAGGLPVPGIAPNPNPARVINLSLGSDGPCRQTYLDVVGELTAAGVVVVASAGNDGGSIDAPANCAGVISVGALRQIGTKVGFSNVGPGLTISAPGGNCVNIGQGQPCLFSIDTATNTGLTVPVSSTFTDQFNFNVGTSFSAPIVAGTVSLMRGVHPALAPAQLIRRLREGTRPFPTTSTTVPAPPVCHVPTSDTDIQAAECICTTQTCGAGLLDTSAALVAALRPLISIQAPGSSVPGQSVAFDANASTAAPGRSVTSYAWTVEFSSGAAPTINGAAQANASVLAPSSGEFALRLTITDSAGAQDTAFVALRTGSSTTTTTITVSQDSPALTPPPPPTPPPVGGGGGGGGGALGWGVLALLLGILRAKRKA